MTAVEVDAVAVPAARQVRQRDAEARAPHVGHVVVVVGYIQLGGRPYRPRAEAESAAGLACLSYAVHTLPVTAAHSLCGPVLRHCRCAALGGPGRAADQDYRHAGHGTGHQILNF